MTPTPDIDDTTQAPQPVVLHQQHALEIVVVEVRYTGVTHTMTTEHALALRERLRATGLDLPQVEGVSNQEVTFEVGANGPQSNITTKDVGWQLSSTDGAVLVLITTDVTRLQTSRYTRWSETIAAPLAEILDVVNNTLQPTLAQRVGVRFVNRFNDPAARSASDWAGRINPAFIGPVEHEALSGQVRSIHSQLDLEFDSASGAVIRHGAFPDPAQHGAVSYLLDIDAYNQAASSPTADTILDTATSLDRTAYDLFKKIASEQLRATLGPTPALSPEPNADDEALSSAPTAHAPGHP